VAVRDLTARQRGGTGSGSSGRCSKGSGGEMAPGRS
jgi:hypothetical protein